LHIFARKIVLIVVQSFAKKGKKSRPVKSGICMNPGHTTHQGAG